MPSPDAPDVVAARFYFIYDTTAWEHSTSREESGKLYGQTKGLSASAALALQNRMQSVPHDGPASFAKAPSLALGVLTDSGQIAPVIGKGKGKGSSRPKKLDGYLKLMATTLERMEDANKLSGDITEKAGSPPFVALLATHRSALEAEYEKIRLIMAGASPDLDSSPTLVQRSVPSSDEWNADSSGYSPHDDQGWVQPWL